ncbi:MAG: orotidine 5'-phosphate decarboxylase / HUMPS family protein [Pseudomonadota bacterium]
MIDYAIILAADVPGSRNVLSLTAQVGHIVDGVKIAAATLLESGVSLIGRIRDVVEDKPILVDLKIADIGFRTSKGWEGTNAKTIKSLQNCGATHVTVHGFPGPFSVAEAVETCHALGLKALLLPTMSHPGAELFFRRPILTGEVPAQLRRVHPDPEFSRNHEITDVTEAILAIGEALYADGYIGPATRPDDLRRYRRFTKKPIWCPGFGRQDSLGRSLETQLREWAAIVGPNSAAIVGSSIYSAADPAAAALEAAELRNKVTSGL